MKMRTLLSILVGQSSSKVFILLFCMTFCKSLLFAQDCSTPDIPPEVAMNFPWFGNPDYLPSFMDSLQSLNSSPNARIESGITWRVPIHFWILTKIV
ncbi:hypothetical protein Fleli_2480 [Bernardetia litoralis DSM 6794]|uniref:Uncharacterized protein n=1 Tax=Bernardetia litoralis (strain ATCC 23117 / DSM 6794 / NBRC 15988 / NCIMB 1366 / Fx l1 / Sio-4) TaxID=880071 RepID=I4ALL0_BERLS|nr:hypothetical protein [Bernardetia litoralis]AFM04845.1 hypothetical protein Fleli_2480 [Bernardetia litoralis DSM 6794]